MRERVRTNDLKILFICPSSQWGTVERRVINDCHYLRDIGGNPVLYCLKGSPIDREAQKLSLPRHFYKGKKVNKIFDLTYFLDLRNLINENKFDIIHCFSIDFVWTVCLLLMTRPQVPLILTFNRFLKKPYWGIIEKWLLKRIDLVMTFSGSVRSIILNNLPVDGRKVRVMGAGVEMIPVKKQEGANSQKVIGCFVSDKSQIENLHAFLFLVQPIFMKLKQGKSNISFMIFSDGPVEEVLDMEETHSLIEQLQLGEALHFVEIQNIQEAIKKMDIYVSLAFNEPFSDLEVMAALGGIPIVVPRTAARRQLLNKLPGIGESFYFQDSRELRDKLLEVLAKYQEHELALEQNFERLNLTHGLDSYVEKVYEQYSRLYSQRMRFASLKGKSN